MQMQKRNLAFVGKKGAGWVLLIFLLSLCTLTAGWGISGIAYGADMADLVITDSKVVTQNPPVGATVFFLIEVKNAGKAAAGPFEVQIEGEKGGRDLQTVNGLEVGATKNLFLKASLGAEREVFTVIVDPNNRVEESDKQNNFLQITVLGQAAPQPPGTQPPTQPSPTTQNSYTWQWSDILASSGSVCIFGICLPTGGSVSQVQAFSSDLADAVQRLGIQSVRMTEGNLPSGLTLDVNIPSRSAALNGTVSNSVGLRLVYDLLDGNGTKSGTLTVLININIAASSTPPVGPPGTGPTPGPTVTLVVRAVLQSTGAQIGGVQISTTAGIINTPGAVTVPMGATINLTASPTINIFGVGTKTFKYWQQCGSGIGGICVAGSSSLTLILPNINTNSEVRAVYN